MPLWLHLQNVVIFTIDFFNIFFFLEILFFYLIIKISSFSENFVIYYVNVILGNFYFILEVLTFDEMSYFYVDLILKNVSFFPQNFDLKLKMRT